MVACAALWCACLFPAAGEAAPYVVDGAKSVFAVLIYKGGLASALGHNHFIAAAEYEAALTADAENPVSTRLRFETPAAALLADDPGLAAAWSPALKASGLIESGYTVQPEKRRAEITAHLRAPNQLDAEAHPVIAAEVLAVEERPMTVETRTYAYAARIKMTVRGRSVERDVAADIAFDGDGALTIEAVGDFAFTEFGIKPFSAALGAVRNKDAFRVYVNVTAAPSDVR